MGRGKEQTLKTIYFKNMELSQDRTRNVFRVCYEYEALVNMKIG